MPFSVSSTILVGIRLRKYRSWDTMILVPGKSRRASSKTSLDSISRWLVGSSRISTLAPESISFSKSKPRLFSSGQRSDSAENTDSPRNRNRPRIFRSLRIVVQTGTHPAALPITVLEPLKRLLSLIVITELDIVIRSSDPAGLEKALPGSFSKVSFFPSVGSYDTDTFSSFDIKIHAVKQLSSASS